MRLAELENDVYRATFLLDLGGRLWSLVHKPSGRELLYQPDVLHFVNIGLCNCWFCGGVEWNVSVRGHAAYTSSPVSPPAAGQRRRRRGRPADLGVGPLPRRGVPDRLLPAGRHTGPAGPPADRQHPQPGHTHVLVVQHGGAGRPRPPSARPGRPGIPVRLRRQGHRPEARARPGRPGRDLPGDAAVGPRLFLRHSLRPAAVGNQPGPRRARARPRLHLAAGRAQAVPLGPGCRRQAVAAVPRRPERPRVRRDSRPGWARTESDYLPMPAGATWEWMESYALMEADPAVAHGSDWAAATGHVNARLDALLPQERLESLLRETAAAADRPPGKLGHHGSQWGGMQHRLRKAEHLPPAAGLTGVKFPAKLTGPFLDWQALLTGGELPKPPAPGDPAAVGNRPGLAEAPGRRRRRRRERPLAGLAAPGRDGLPRRRHGGGGVGMANVHPARSRRPGHTATWPSWPERPRRSARPPTCTCKPVG